MATVKFYLKNFKKGKHILDKDAVIFAKFTASFGQRFELRIGESVNPKHWDFKKKCVRGTHPRHYELNLYLQRFEMNLKNLYDKHRDLPFDKFKLIATASGSEKKTLFIALNQFLKAYSVEKDSKTLGRYNTMAAQLQKFDEIHSIDFHSFDHNFYDAFKEHLYTIPNPNYRDYRLIPIGNSSNDYSLDRAESGIPVGLFDDTVFKYIVNLKTFCRWAGKRGYKVNPSFEEWEVIERHYEPITLDFDELERLENFEFTIENVKPHVKKGGDVHRVIKAVNESRDYLALECRTGQRISDLKRFNLKDFSDFIWSFYPYKGRRLSSTKRHVYFKGFCLPALFILEKYGYQMPKVSEQKINDNIKTACKIVGINTHTEIYRWAQNKRIRIQGPKYEFLSSHTGRRSFVTIALQFIEPKLVKDLAGMSWATLARYEGKSSKKNIEQALEKMDSKPVMKKVL